jgi:hypothetical protein
MIVGSGFFSCECCGLQLSVKVRGGRVLVVMGDA